MNHIIMIVIIIFLIIILLACVHVYMCAFSVFAPELDKSFNALCGYPPKGSRQKKTRIFYGQADRKGGA